jgi:hypothetical protein
MERVIALLQEKNHCLEKFYWLNEQELINFGAGNFDSVEEFYQAREQILTKIKCLEGMLSEISDRPNAQVTTALREEADTLLKSKDEVVKSILAQDLQILAYIEKEKSNIIRELRANKQAKRAVGAYANTERLRALDSE